MKNSRDYDLKLNYQKLIKYKIFGFDHWWLPIVEASYRPNDVQIEYTMFCNLNDTSCNVSNFKNGLVCTHTFNYELWDNFCGGINHIVRRFSKFKEGCLESSQIQEW